MGFLFSCGRVNVQLFLDEAGEGFGTAVCDDSWLADYEVLWAYGDFDCLEDLMM